MLAREGIERNPGPLLCHRNYKIVTKTRHLLNQFLTGAQVRQVLACKGIERNPGPVESDGLEDPLAA